MSGSSKATRWAAATALVASLAAPAPGRAAQPAATMVRGDTVTAFTAQDLDGAVKHITFPKGSATVFLFLLSGCPTCHKMIPEWNRAYERRPANVNVVGVLMDREPPGFLQATRIAFPLVRSPGRDFLELWKVRQTPTTIRIGAGGTVQDVAVGIVDPIRLGEIFRP